MKQVPALWWDDATDPAANGGPRYSDMHQGEPAHCRGLSWDGQEIGLRRFNQETKGMFEGISLEGSNWEKLAPCLAAIGATVDAQINSGNALAAALMRGRATVIGARLHRLGHVAHSNILWER